MLELSRGPVSEQRQARFVDGAALSDLGVSEGPIRAYCRSDIMMSRSHSSHPATSGGTADLWDVLSIPVPWEMCRASKPNGYWRELQHFRPCQGTIPKFLNVDVAIENL
jgi:hypothetical protein